MEDNVINRNLTFKSPQLTRIDYVQGVNAIPIEFTITDYGDIPYGSTAELWVTRAASEEHKHIQGSLHLPLHPDTADSFHDLQLMVRIEPTYELFRLKGTYFGTVVITFPNGKSLASYPISIKVYEDAGEVEDKPYWETAGHDTVVIDGDTGLEFHYAPKYGERNGGN